MLSSKNAYCAQFYAHLISAALAVGDYTGFFKWNTIYKLSTISHNLILNNVVYTALTAPSGKCEWDFSNNS